MSAAREIAVRCVEAAGGFAALRWLQRDGLTILCYHSVTGGALPELVSYGGLHLSARAFREHVDYIARHYNVVPLEAVADAIRAGGRGMPPRAVALTFDDGYANNVTRAAEILAGRKLTATLFLATDYIGSAELYWWDELGTILSAAPHRSFTLGEPWGCVDLSSRPASTAFLRGSRRLLEAAPIAERRGLLDLLAGGLLGGSPDVPLRDELRPATWAELSGAAGVFSYGAHTAQHRVLDRLLPGQVEEEVTRCLTAIEGHLGGAAVPAFSYPAGRFSDAIRRQVSQLGFSTAVTTESAPPLASDELAGADPSRLPRTAIAAGTSTALLAATIAGVPAIAQRALSRFQRPEVRLGAEVGPG